MNISSKTYAHILNQTVGIGFDLKPSPSPSPLGGMKLWVTILLEWDNQGQAKILRSFSRPAADSDVKKAQTTKPQKQKPIEQEVKEQQQVSLFE